MYPAALTGVCIYTCPDRMNVCAFTVAVCQTVFPPPTVAKTERIPDLIKDITLPDYLPLPPLWTCQTPAGSFFRVAKMQNILFCPALAFSCNNQPVMMRDGSYAHAHTHTHTHTYTGRRHGRRWNILSHPFSLCSPSSSCTQPLWEGNWGEAYSFLFRVFSCQQVCMTELCQNLNFYQFVLLSLPVNLVELNFKLFILKRQNSKVRCRFDYLPYAWR